MTEIFPLRQPLNYSIRHEPDFSTSPVNFFTTDDLQCKSMNWFLYDGDLRHDRINSVFYGTESLGYLGQKIWELVHAKLKNAESLETFTYKVRSKRVAL